MTLTWAQLRDLECGELEGAADGWGKATNRADAGRDRIETQLLNGLRDTQHGEAANAAVARLRQMGRNLSYVYTECGLLRTTLNGNLLGVVDRFWRRSGYRIKAVNKNVNFPAIYAQTKDGFGVSLSIGGAGQAFFEVDSPCVEASEIAESTTPPNGPDYDGVYPLPRPNIHSDFWSADPA
ncbi:hypothetical protein PUR34_06910 [Streptomyces sp. JV185]|uniref:hypothetical protein n=1 Tax=Streptomyces sp. JV185 TaxID=858638 RepID=UPI002E75A830|nr:hypothetical protein [Streptomyces sp. JV185]MEE1767920.1 hypothetical protein [Streptomyces sp. JV185]